MATSALLHDERCHHCARSSARLHHLLPVQTTNIALVRAVNDKLAATVPKWFGKRKRRRKRKRERGSSLLRSRFWRRQERRQKDKLQATNLCYATEPKTNIALEFYDSDNCTALRCPCAVDWILSLSLSLSASTTLQVHARLTLSDG